MPQFAPGETVALGPVRLRAERVRGEVGALDADDIVLAENLGRSGVPDAGTVSLRRCLAATEGRVEHSVPLSELEPVGDLPVVSLEVPPPGPEETRLLLEVDDVGLLRWHLPEPVGGVQEFRVPVEQVDLPEAAGLVGVGPAGVGKVLHLVRFPIGAAGEALVAEWEERFRPYGTAIVTPETLLEPINGRRLTSEQWASLDGRPTLLLLHGTFSRARDAFHGLAADGALLAELSRRYEGRVIAFDHPTLHVGPERNVEFFLAQVPDGVEPVLDVLAHSRGGLVARHLARDDRLRVRMTVHVATPNAGTPLAGPERIRDFIDTMTNLLVLGSGGPAEVVLPGVLQVLKHLAAGTAGGLDGLAAMDPDGPALRALNEIPAGPRDCAVASDFQATAASVLHALDQVVDGYFDAANDLVVPTASASGAGRFTVAESHTVPVIEAVSHNGFFASDFVRERLAAHLTAAP